MAVGESSQPGLQFSFEYTLFVSDDKTLKAALDHWKKNKKVSQNVESDLLNTVLTKCNVAAILLSREVNLPPPVQLPKVQV